MDYDPHAAGAPMAPSPRGSEADAVQRRSTVQTSVLDAAAANEEKPVRCAKFRAQELWAWKPVWSPQVVYMMYLIVAVIFIPLGVVVFVQSNRLSATPRWRYDKVPACDVGNSSSLDTSRSCVLRFDVDKNMTAPSYFYYGIVNFYQNARTYASSRSDAQLRGDKREPSTDECDPLTRDQNNTGNVIVPCGLVAASRFNDTLELCRDIACQDPVNVTKKGIAWDIDVNTRFVGSDEKFTPEQNALIRDEDFMVWMRLSAYRNWKKLYRIISEDLPAGQYYVRINATYPVESFDGEKFFFLSETTWFGGPNDFLGYAYIVTGGIALLLAILFFIGSRYIVDGELPPETTVSGEGFVKNPFIPTYAPGADNDDDP